MSKYLYRTVYEKFTGNKPPEPADKKNQRKRGCGHPYRIRFGAKKNKPTTVDKDESTEGYEQLPDTKEGRNDRYSSYVESSYQENNPFYTNHSEDGENVHNQNRNNPYSHEEIQDSHAAYEVDFSTNRPDLTKQRGPRVAYKGRRLQGDRYPSPSQYDDREE